MPEEEKIFAQGGILVAINMAKRYRAGYDCLLHFRVRNLLPVRRKLTMSISAPQIANLHRDRETIELLPLRAEDIQFPFTAVNPGDKLIRRFEVELECLGDKRSRRLVLPDHSVVVNVAKPEEEAGHLDLRGTTIEFDDHIGDISIGDLAEGLSADLRDLTIKVKKSTGDVKISQLIREQDRAGGANGQAEEWAHLELIPRPDGWVVPDFRREAGVTDLALLERRAGSGRGRRFFLFARQELRFGLKARACYLGDEIFIPMVVYRLPCRSNEQDSRNHQLSSMISKFHGAFRLRNHVVCLRDHSSNGILLDGQRMEKETWEPLPRRFELRLIPDILVLSLGGRVFYPSKPGRVLTLVYPLDEGAGESLWAGSEHPHPVDALRIKRENNYPEHSYVQVFRKALVGSRNAAVLLADEGIETPHASIVFHCGEWFVTAESDTARVLVGDYEVKPECYVPLVDGTTLTFGETEFQVRANRLDYMGTV